MIHNFAGKVALITGGGSGIGRAIALAFAASGAKVVIGDVLEEGAKETIDLIKRNKGEGSRVYVDTSVEADVANMVKFAISTYGRLDVACNNAGISPKGKMTTDYLEAEWDKVMDINLKGVWLCMKHEIPELLKQPLSAIVNTSSAVCMATFPQVSAYTASKQGIIGLTKTSALEYARTGLRINAVCPGTTRGPILDNNPDLVAEITKLIPMGRLGEPEEMADAVLWLCSENASYVNGHALVVDGALSA